MVREDVSLDCFGARIQIWLSTNSGRHLSTGSKKHGRRKEIEYATELEKSNGNAASREGVTSSVHDMQRFLAACHIVSASRIVMLLSFLVPVSC